MIFFNNLRSELLKCKKTAAFWLTMSGAAFIPFINVVKCIAKPDYFVPQVMKDPWNVWLDYNWQVVAGFFLALYIILVTSLIVQIEYRSNAWKQVYASPRSYADIFFSKFLIILFTIAGCFLMFSIFMIFAAFITSLLQPRYHFDISLLPAEKMFAIAGRMLASIFAMTALQYWMSMRFKSFAVPMGVGLALFITGLMIRQWEHIDLYPYSYPMLVYFRNQASGTDLSTLALVYSSMMGSIFLLLGFLDLVFRKEKG